MDSRADWTRVSEHRRIRRTHLGYPAGERAHQEGFLVTRPGRGIFLAFNERTTKRRKQGPRFTEQVQAPPNGVGTPPGVAITCAFATPGRRHPLTCRVHPLAGGPGISTGASFAWAARARDRHHDGSPSSMAGSPQDAVAFVGRVAGGVIRPRVSGRDRFPRMIPPCREPEHRRGSFE